MPDWFQLVIGLNDLLDAYRQCPNAPSQAHLNVVGFWHSLVKEWVYVVLKGHVFGKLAAVLNFCRLPCLTSAFAKLQSFRHMTLAMADRVCDLIARC